MNKIIKNSESSSLVNHLGIKFIFAFVILASIAIGNFLFIRYHSSFEGSAGAVINISGQQRMLSQRIGLLSVKMVHETDQDKQQLIKQELSQLIQRLDKYHNGLVQGNHELNLPAATRDEVKDIYFKAPHHLDEQIVMFVYLGYQLLKVPTEELTENNSYYQQVVSISSSEEFLSGLNILVKSYEKILTEQLDRLALVNNVIVISNLICILLIGWILILPVLSRLKQQVKKIIAQNHQLSSEINARRKLVREKDQLATAMEQLSETVIITDKDRRIKYVNQAFEECLGYSKQEVIGKKSDIIRSEKHPDLFYENIWKTVLGKRVWKGVITNRTKSGEFISTQTRVTPVYDNNGEVDNIVFIKIDVSRELELEKQLRTSQKMQTIGNMAGGISHAFNNILTSIVGYSQMLEECVDEDNQTAHKYIASINDAGARAGELVKQILLFSRRTNIEKQPIHIEKIANEVIRSITPTLPATTEIIFNSCETSTISGNPAQIEQVVTNLCSNASNAMPAGGKLTIQVEDEVSLPEHKFPGAGKNQKYVHLSVTDTGTGIDDITLIHLFEPFFTTKPNGKGSGLGLAVVQGIMDSHDALIYVDSEVGVGTVFNLYFPIVKLKQHQEVNKKTSSVGRSEHILVVDDEELILHFVTTLLESEGYKVTALSDSTDALKQVQQNPDEYDLLFTDYSMPKLNGLKLAEAVKALNKAMPVVLATGYQADVPRAGEKVYQLLTKPFTATSLMQIVHQALEKD